MIRIVCMSGVGLDGVAYDLKYPMLLDDSGRSKSTRPKQKNDCTVRAIALVRGMGYDEAYDLMAEEGRKCSKGFDIVKWLKKQSWAKKMAFPAVKGERRMNPAKFCETYKEGKYICRVSKHVFAVIDGVVHDTFESRPDRCIYTAWKVAP